MKSIFAALACLLLTTAAFSQGAHLTITVKNVSDDKDYVSAALYNSDEDFMKKTWQSKRVKSAAGEVQLVFENVPPGNYAVSIMHDANKNDKLDSNMMGIPKEGFGFSNDVMGTFGPPAFEKAKFAVSVDLGIAINLKYY